MPDLTDPDGPPFATKVAVLVADDLEPWQELNVTSFLVSGIATSQDGLVGEAYEDADGQRYLPMLRQPVLVFVADAETLRRAHGRALGRGMSMAIYTRELFGTGHDEANRAAVRAVPTAELDLVGIAVRGPKNAVDKTIKGARLHP